jgi:HD-GYP domain-containing protein (c-di-GMP phosphodiesterase class II)
LHSRSKKLQLRESVWLIHKRSSPVPKSILALRNTAAGLEGRVWESDRLLRIGRLQGLEVVLNDDSVSRHHAEAALTSEGWVAHDLGSTNGSFLNGVRLGRAGKGIQPGDILQCGNVTLAVQIYTGKTVELNPPPGRQPRAEVSLRQSWDHGLALFAAETARHPKGVDRLLKLMQIGRAPNTPDTLEDYACTVLWEAAEALDARNGALLMEDLATGLTIPRAVFAFGDRRHHRSWSGSDLPRQALARGQSLLFPGPAGGPGDPADGGPGVGSVICALLRSCDKPFGVLCLARTRDQEAYTEDDLRLADALALCASDSLDTVARILENKRDLLVQALSTLTQMVGLRDDYTARHAQRVTTFALLLAEQMKLPPQDCYHLRTGTPLLDLGMLGVSAATTGRPGPLSQQEQASLKAHVLKGAALLEAIPGLAPLAMMVRSHHEHWDGSGYPDGLTGERIPLLARVVALADAFDAMTTERPYRPALSVGQAFEEIKRQAGKQFDPACVKVFLQLCPQIEAFFAEWGGTERTMSREELFKTRAEIVLD